MNVQYFKIADSQQVAIHFYQLGPQSVIQFMRTPHTLLAMEFHPPSARIHLNAYINGEPMRQDIIIPMVDPPLQHIRIRYQPRNQTCVIIQNNTLQHRCKIQDFNFNLVVAIQCQVDVKDVGAKNLSSGYLETFLSQASQLTSFQGVLDNLDGVKLHPEDFKKMIQKCGHQQSQRQEKGHKNISQYMDIFSQKQIKLHDIVTEKKDKDETKFHKWPMTLVNGTDQVSMLLHQNGTISIKKQIIGDWRAWKTSLWLAYDKQLRQLRWNKTEWVDQSGGKWFWSGDLSPGQFLTKYHSSDDIFIIIITCFKKIKQAMEQQNTWVSQLQSLGIRCLFVAGDPSLQHPELTGNYLILPVEDSYECLPKKVFYAFSFVYRHYQFRYLYKVDDDAYVNGIYFMYLHQILEGHHYLGKGKTVGADFNRQWHQGKCQKDSLNRLPYPAQRITPGVTYARGEAGYFLSREALESLFPYERYIVSDLYEDKVIGDCLEKEGYRLHEAPLYQTKLYEKFGQKQYLDRYGLIVDVPHHQFQTIQRHFQQSIYAIVG
jgi:hypothetical protein